MCFMDSVKLLPLFGWISEYWMADEKLDVLQIEQTRNDPSGSGQQNPFTVVDTIAELTRLLQLLVQNALLRGHRDPNIDFLETQPPVFRTAEDPLDAEHWPRTIEQKLGLIPCTDIQKTQFATQQLHGPAGAWWANHLAMQPTERQIP